MREQCCTTDDPNTYSCIKFNVDETINRQAIHVSLRIRPFTLKEHANLNSCIKQGKAKHAVYLTSQKVEEKRSLHTFEFDSTFWSVDADDAGGCKPATQEDVFTSVGLPLVRHAFDGFNSCLFAYGQTGSGKTYTMMGANVNSLEGETAGVTPRVCLEIFKQKADLEVQGHTHWTVELGYIEIYNERVSDLLAKRSKKTTRPSNDTFVEVREHPVRGVFIEGQRLVEVHSLRDIVQLIESGNEARHTAATKMNDYSSRSHAIVMLVLREERVMTIHTGDQIKTAGKNSHMNLVDLAGSERILQSAAAGMRFTEATHINLSLTTLGRVIDILADMATKGSRSQWSMPPYRESKLTFILKDSLGGNSKTFMIATVSPSILNYDETLSTLRYASRARDVVNTAQVNEDPRARRIRELEDQMESMRHALQAADPVYVNQLEEKLALIEADVQRRAADLQALEKVRAQSQLQERILRATEAEKEELTKLAQDLQRQVEESRRQAEAMTTNNMRLQEEQSRKEREMMAEMEKRDAALSTIRRELDDEIKTGRIKLEEAVSALEKERQEREAALVAIRQHQERLDIALHDSKRTEDERQILLQENNALNAQKDDLIRQVQSKQSLLSDLARIQSEAEQMQNTKHLLLCSLDEMQLRYHHTCFFLLQLNELTVNMHNKIIDQKGVEYETIFETTLETACKHQKDWDEKLAQANTRIRDYEKEVGRQSEELESMRNTNTALEAQLEALRRSNSTLDGQRTSLEERVGKQSEELESMRNTNTALEADEYTLEMCDELQAESYTSPSELYRVGGVDHLKEQVKLLQIRLDAHRSGRIFEHIMFSRSTDDVGKCWRDEYPFTFMFLEKFDLHSRDCSQVSNVF